MGTFSLKGGIPVVSLMGKGTTLSKQAKNANFSTKYPTLNTDFSEMRKNQVKPLKPQLALWLKTPNPEGFWITPKTLRDI